MMRNPIMLVGIAGAAVPLVLHLLNRSRFLARDWGAMMFLEAAASGVTWSQRLRQYAPLLVRMGAVALLAIALARPVIGDAEEPPARRPVSAVIVLDASASMSMEEMGRARIDRARAAAMRILAALEPEDEAALVLAGRPATPPSLSRNHKALANRIADVEPSHASANLAEALGRAVALLDAREERERRLYVVCDRQAESWAHVTDAFVSAWRDPGAASARLDRFIVVPVGAQSGGNVAIRSIVPAMTPLVRDVGTELLITIRNFGDTVRPAVPLTVNCGDRELFGGSLALPASAMTVFRVPVVFDSAEDVIVTASIRGPGLSGDDRREAVLCPTDPVPILLVSDDEQEMRYVSAALAPFRAASAGGADVADVASVGSSEFSSRHLLNTSEVLLGNIRSITPAQARLIEQFVERGGGLLFAPGDLAPPELLNAMLYRNGAGLLPAALAAPVNDSVGAPCRVTDRGFSSFAGGGELLPPGVVRRYWRLEPSSSARVVARIGAEPLLVERAFGRGRVLLWAATVGDDWGAIPLQNGYVPLLQGLVRSLATTRADERNLTCGQEIVASVDEPIEGRPIMVLPDGSTSPAEVIPADGGNEMRFTETDEPGRYILRARLRAGSRAIPFIVSPPQEESDLTPLGQERWQWFAKALAFDIVEPDSLDADRDPPKSGTELSAGLIVLVIALLSVELLLARTPRGE